MSKILPGTKTTRMELLRLKTRMKLAERGHDLLKEKRDSLIMEFFNAIAEIKEARATVEKSLREAFSALTQAKMIMGPAHVVEFAYASQVETRLDISTRSMMGVRIPMLNIEQHVPALPYSLPDSSVKLDTMSQKFLEALQAIVRLAEVESTVKRLAHEIERTKRRVSALETVVIPRLEATVRFVKLALEEREREDFYRIKLVKARISQTD
ncbi:MAG TPA: V-type ATP synthase subunit D [Candidatus Thorarchaeota archaeon]|nr:V-type ATP synthase subunit D [Candidatus Thorarchaeota archaeon]